MEEPNVASLRHVGGNGTQVFMSPSIALLIVIKEKWCGGRQIGFLGTWNVL
jgi:hypothetical protein